MIFIILSKKTLLFTNWFLQDWAGKPKKDSEKRKSKETAIGNRSWTDQINGKIRRKQGQDVIYILWHAAF